nr:HMG1/2-like protein [Ipomoea batatas]GME09024.1 HMG1/2-like protein [Ipomoea batatas]
MKGGKSKAHSIKVDNKLAVKKRGKNVKDPNKPKRLPSAFFVFMEQFRKEYKEKHPKDKSVATVGKEKAPYIAKAEQRKEDYNRQMEAYDKKIEEECLACNDDGSIANGIKDLLEFDVVGSSSKRF